MRTTLAHVMLWVVAAALLVPPAAWGADDVEAQLAQLKQALAQLQQQQVRPAGRDLYSAECATCHGNLGDGKGPAEGRFAQHATDFTQGVYKLRSTLSKSPLPGDLERSIRQGMPGTEMVPFREVLTDAEITAVASYVRSLTKNPADPTMQEEARQNRVAMPDKRPFPPSAESVAKGKSVYANRCLECHGDHGEGSTKEKDDWGFPVQMMDFRGGVFKAGPTDFDLYRVISAGMNGTSMGGYFGDLSPEDEWNVIDYMRSLHKAPSGFIAGVWNYLFVERPNGFNYYGVR